jgi:hypothetical protein
MSSGKCRQGGRIENAAQTSNADRLLAAEHQPAKKRVYFGRLGSAAQKCDQAADDAKAIEGGLMRAELGWIK